MSLEIDPTRTYKSNIEQLNLMLKHGPLGVKIVNGQLEKNSFKDSGINYLSVCLSIFTRKQSSHLTNMIDLLDHKANEIREMHECVTRNQGDYPEYFRTASSVIDLWNTRFGLPGSIKSSLQSFLLKASGVNWRALHINRFYIRFSMPVACPMLREIFNYSFSNLQQLPLIITPKDPAMSSEELINLLTNNQDVISDLLKTYGAIKFRGFPINSFCLFEQIVESALGCKSEDYIGGDGSRDKVEEIGVENVHSSTLAPEEYEIRLHQERSIVPQMSEFISFYCKTPPRPGTGQTILGKAEDVTLSLMNKPLWQRFVNPDLTSKNLTYISRHPPEGHLLNKIDPTHRTWQEVLGIPKGLNKAESTYMADSISRERKFDYHWDGEWYVRTTEAPAIREHPYKPRQPLWMNQVHFSKLTSDLLGSKFLYLLVKLLYIFPRTWRSDVRFSDGSPVLDADIREIFATKKEHETYCDWDRHDLLIADNRTVMHGRASSDPKEGKRQIYTVISSKSKM